MMRRRSRLPEQGVVDLAKTPEVRSTAEPSPAVSNHRGQNPYETTDIALRLFGAYAPKKIDMDIKKQETKIILTPEIIDRLERYYRQQAELEAMGHITPSLPKEETPF
jgi:hypothetical protein